MSFIAVMVSETGVDMPLGMAEGVVGIIGIIGVTGVDDTGVPDRVAGALRFNAI